MVKSKKLSRGSLAVLLLALLLALSMVVGITGAWFTDKDESGSASDDATFGIVDVEIGASQMAVTIADKLYVPGDAVATVTAGFTNNSNVAIKYCYDVALTVKEGDNDVSDQFTIGAYATESVYGELAANATAPTIASIAIQAKDTMGNAHQNKTVTITVTLKVYAIQSANTTSVTDAASLKAELA